MRTAEGRAVSSAAFEAAGAAACLITDAWEGIEQFLTPDLIEAKAPTWPKGRSAPWTGCNILLGEVPEIGRIDIVREGAPLAKAEVLARWERTRFVRERRSEARGWLLAVMRCVERLGAEFTLAEAYAFEAELAALYPALQASPHHYVDGEYLQAADPAGGKALPL